MLALALLPAALSLAASNPSAAEVLASAASHPARLLLSRHGANSPVAGVRFARSGDFKVMPAEGAVAIALAAGASPR